MVSYQRWTEIAFRVARQKGMETSQENSQNLISIVADVWNERKSELNAATVSQAENVAEQEISVSR
jgi:hypothetical protein